MLCTEMFVKNSVLITEYMFYFLNRKHKANAQAWDRRVKDRLIRATNWLMMFQEQHGNATAFSQT